MRNKRVFITVIFSFLLAAGTSCLYAQDYSRMEAAGLALATIIGSLLGFITLVFLEMAFCYADT